MNCRVLPLKLSQEASLRRERLLASSKQSRPEKLLLPTKHALLYSFPSFLKLSVDSVIHVGAICSEGLQAGLLFILPSSCMASLAPEITTHKLYSFKHCLAHYL